MSLLRFEWNDKKAAFNLRKHGISFEEAETVFLDDEALILPDDRHSSDEERFLILGFSYQLRMLVVCHCYRESNDVVRIFSARKATKAEQMQYQRRRIE
jgi:uncharacterized DUF497 family protein